MNSYELTLLILNIGAIPTVLNLLKKRKWFSARATVEKVDREPFGDGFRRLPHLKYKINGREYTILYKGPTEDDLYDLGEKRDIIINPGDERDILLGNRLVISIVLVAIAAADLVSILAKIFL